jgi:hypothetical protein
MTSKKSIKKNDLPKVNDQIVVAGDQAQAIDQAQNQVQAQAIDQTQAIDQAKNPSQVVAGGLLGLSVLALINAPKTKIEKSAKSVEKIKVALKSLDDQNLDYLAFSLSLFGRVVSLNDIRSIVSLSKDFDQSISSLILKSALGSVDSDDNFSGVINCSSSNGQAIDLNDHQVFSFSKGYDLEKKNSHQGLYCWQVQKFVKAILICLALGNEKNLVVPPPAQCPFISLSWQSFASVMLALGCSKMNDDKIDHLKKSFDGALIDHLSSNSLLIDIDLKQVFNLVSLEKKIFDRVLPPAVKVDKNV